MNFVEDWDGFEKLVADLHNTGSVNVKKNVKLIGNSGTPREIDVLVTHKEGLYEHKILIECKYWKYKIKRTHIDSMITAIDDLNASKGVFFTTKGYQDGAKKMAENKGIEIFVVRELGQKEWGLPGKVIDFYIQFFSRSIGNLKVEDGKVLALNKKENLTSIKLDIQLGNAKSHTPIIKENGELGKSFEKLIVKGSLKALKKLTKDSFLINNGEDCTRYMMGHVNMPFNPPKKILKDDNILLIPKISFDLGIKVDQTRFKFDRSSKYQYVVMVENCINNVLYTAYKQKSDEISNIEKYIPIDKRISEEEVLENGSILKIYLETWFDFKEINNKKPIPIEEC